MSSSYTVYVDEAGDEGFKFKEDGSGSSEWFVLSALAIRAQNDDTIIQAVAEVRNQLGKPVNYPLHFRGLRHEQRIPYVTALAKLRIRTITVLVHKPSLKEPETFTNYRLYHYCVRLLLERVSWLCRDEHIKTLGDGSARIVFSNRSSMSYANLRDYVSKLINTGNPLEVRIEPAVIKPEKMEPRQHHQYAGLQAADAIASSFYFGVQTHRLGFTEPRYVEILKPTIYKKDREAIGYGIKLWPNECAALISKEKSLEWITTQFGKK